MSQSAHSWFTILVFDGASVRHFANSRRENLFPCLFSDHTQIFFYLRAAKLLNYSRR
jgi:hypothetical protein